MAFALKRPLPAEMERMAQLREESPERVETMLRLGRTLEWLASEGMVEAADKALDGHEDDVLYWYVVKMFNAACICNRPAFVRWMVDNGLQLQAPPLADGLHIVISNAVGEHDTLPLVRFLLSSGFDVNRARRGDLWTPLHVAADAGLLAVSAELLRAGADVNAVAKDDVMPLHLAEGKLAEAMSAASAAPAPSSKPARAASAAALPSPSTRPRMATAAGGVGTVSHDDGKVDDAAPRFATASGDVGTVAGSGDASEDSHEPRRLLSSASGGTGFTRGDEAAASTSAAAGGASRMVDSAAGAVTVDSAASSTVVSRGASVARSVSTSVSTSSSASVSTSVSTAGGLEGTARLLSTSPPSSPVAGGRTMTVAEALAAIDAAESSKEDAMGIVAGSVVEASSSSSSSAAAAAVMVTTSIGTDMAPPDDDVEVGEGVAAAGSVVEASSSSSSAVMVTTSIGTDMAPPDDDDEGSKEEHKGDESKSKDADSHHVLSTSSTAAAAAAADDGKPVLVADALAAIHSSAAPDTTSGTASGPPRAVPRAPAGPLPTASSGDVVLEEDRRAALVRLLEEAGGKRTWRRAGW